MVTESIRVSIVSIQADQSRRVDSWDVHYGRVCFNRINSGRSIPTITCMADQDKAINCFNRINSVRSIPTSTEKLGYAHKFGVSIVSIQADLSRRSNSTVHPCPVPRCFNRINSGRSIPTKFIAECLNNNNKFQSYQFRQIYPDSWLKLQSYSPITSFNRINSGRSIPTRRY